MKCLRCNSAATLHYSAIENRHCAFEQHLCNDCAQEAEASWNRRQSLKRTGIPNYKDRAVCFDFDSILITEMHDQQVVTLREVAGNRDFVLVCGIFEATVLSRIVSQQESPRPLTHQTWVNSIVALGGQPQDVIIDELDGSIFYARLRVQQGDRTIAIDSRPTDAFVVALICGIPIYIAEKVLAVTCQQ